MPKIVIKGYDVLYDKCDEGIVLSREWGITFGWKDAPYARHADVSMHRLIMRTPKGMLTDHKNHNTLDNRRKNLRIVTRAQNMHNQRNTCGSSKYKGVHWREDVGKWRAEITVNWKKQSLGFHSNEDDAARAYNRAAKEHFGEHACLNIIKRKTK